MTAKKESRIAICRFCDREYKVSQGRSSKSKICEECQFILSRLNPNSYRGIKQVLEGYRLIIIRNQVVWITPDDYRIKKALPVPPKMLNHLKERLRLFA